MTPARPPSPRGDAASPPGGARPDASPSLAPGERMGPYTADRFLGGGGMGQVYEARGPEGRRVALKVLELGKAFGDDEEAAHQRLEREGEVLAELGHPNIVGFVAQGVDEASGRLYLAVEYVAGRDLDDLLEASPRGRLTPAEVVYLLDMCARGLASAHAKGIAHRDIKPGNVLVTDDARVKLSDFGLALASDVSVRLTARDQTVGTLEYMAPEVLNGDDHTPAADLYALGALAYTLVAGRPPFTCDKPTDLIYAHLAKAPPPLASVAPDTPPGLAKLIGHLLNKAPDARPSAGLLHRTLGGMGVLPPETVAAEWTAGRIGAGAFQRGEGGDGAEAKEEAPPAAEATFRIPPKARLSSRPRGRLIRPRRRPPGGA